MKSDFILAITQLSAEKNLETHTVLAAVEAAMASALKKDELQYAELEVKIDADSGEIELWRIYEVMADEIAQDLGEKARGDLEFARDVLAQLGLIRVRLGQVHDGPDGVFACLGQQHDQSSRMISFSEPSKSALTIVVIDRAR